MQSAYLLSPEELERALGPLVTRAVEQALAGRAAGTPSKDGDWLTQKEAVAYLKISKPSFLRARREGHFKAYGLFKRHLYLKAELDSYVLGQPLKPHETA